MNLSVNFILPPYRGNNNFIRVDAFNKFRWLYNKIPKKLALFFRVVINDPNNFQILRFRSVVKNFCCFSGSKKNSIKT